MTCENVEITCVSSVLLCKQENVCFNWTMLHHKISPKIKKLKVETICLLKEAFQILAVSIVESWTACLELWNRCPGDPINPKIFWRILKEEFETIIKKIGRKNGSMFSYKRMVFWEKNVKCTALESEDDVSELICVFVHFSFLFFGRYTRLFSQN